MTAPRQRVDVWLHRARFAKTRAAATRLVSEGGVRLVHEGITRRIEKASVEVAAGDALLFTHRGRLIAVRVEGIGAHRRPSAEARGLYSELAADEVA